MELTKGRRLSRETCWAPQGDPWTLKTITAWLLKELVKVRERALRRSEASRSITSRADPDRLIVMDVPEAEVVAVEVKASREMDRSLRLVQIPAKSMTPLCTLMLQPAANPNLTESLILEASPDTIFPEKSLPFWKLIDPPATKLSKNVPAGAEEQERGGNRVPTPNPP
jgi:hypothetical protein